MITLFSKRRRCKSIKTVSCATNKKKCSRNPMFFAMHVRPTYVLHITGTAFPSGMKPTRANVFLFCKSRNVTNRYFIFAGVLHCWNMYKMYIFNFLCFFLCVEQHQCFCLFLVCHKIFLYSFLCFFLSKYSCLKQLPLPRKLTLLLFDTIHLYVTYFLQLRKNYLLDYPKSLFFLWAG